MSTSAPEPPVSGSHYQPRLGVVLTLLIAFVAAAFVVLHSPSPAATGPAATTTTTTTAPGTHATTTTTPTRSRVRVQVANGTLTTGLAGSYTQLLITLGWDALPQVNASSRVTKTIVYFNPGFQWAAQQIASQIKVPASAVTPLNGQTPVPGASGDDVVVVLGPDVAVS
ncbi:MAG: LytR C-terminal domain-containing protein [Acidobacteriota bacterium]|nr:LytR C-terminal domain-containing protein [Acidobacteriota bacterium]MDE3083436.1 LytR C-terminal domain-containing protein [Acidobacteriota bacterium]